jgi:homoserine kinase
MLGLARGDWDLLARGLHDRLHQQARAPLFPRSWQLARRARELGALGATISGAGPAVLFWCFYEQTGAVAEALAAEVDGWARVVRAPFESQGAYVGEL